MKATVQHHSGSTRHNPARLLPLVFIMLAGCLFAGEPTPAFPLWDGSESVAEYAKRVNLPATKTLDLGGGVNMESMLIPAGKFVVGTPAPVLVDEDGFQKKIVMGQALMAVSAIALLIMLVVVIVQAVPEKRRPQLSLRLLLLITVAAGGAVLSCVHWRLSAGELDRARLDFRAAQARFDVGYNEEKPSHRVTLTKPFYVGKSAVTQEQYEAMIGAAPSTPKGKDYPVENVSWDDAQAFCNKLSQQTNQFVRLPTEAEWEYACRAGTRTTFFSGDAETDLGRVAWYDKNSKGATRPVEQKEPNAFGLYDMHGNVWQWCQDWFAEDYYGKSPATDPEGPAQGTLHLLRGGSWRSIPVLCRSASRHCFNADWRGNNIGFRIVIPASTQP